jgi:hypothetical protein
MSAAAIAQTAHVYHHIPPATGSITNTVLCNNACTGPVPQQAVAPGYPTFPLTGFPNGTPLGGHALDQINEVEYVSDGPTIAMHRLHPLYDGSKLCTAGNACLPFGPGPAGPFTFVRPPTAPGVTFGDITGMAYRQTKPPCGPVLYVTDGVYIMGLSPCLGPATVAGAPLTGLECDLYSGAIIACDVNGFTYITSNPPCGISLPPGLGPIAPPATMPPGTVIIGNVYDRSLSGINLYVTDGVWLYPVISSCPLPVFIGPPAPGQISRGASFSAEPIVLQSCAGTYSPLIIGTNQPIIANATNLNVTLDAPVSMAGLSAVLVYGSCAGIALPVCSGCQLWVNLAGYGFVGTTLDGAGDVCLDVGTIPYFPLTIYLQWVVIDPSCPSGLQLSDALHCRISDA